MKASDRTLLTPLRKWRRNGVWVRDCVCECGNKTVVKDWYIRTGKTKSCGCLRRPTVTKEMPEPPSGAKHIPLSRGQYAIIDEEDYDLVSQYSWHAVKSGHVVRSTNEGAIFLHNFIMGTNPREIDHRNLNPLDNRKMNLRRCTDSQNHANQGIRKNNTSGCKGVSRAGEKWRAYIVKNYKQISLGYFPTKEEASKAYENAAIQIYGEFARVA